MNNDYKDQCKYFTEGITTTHISSEQIPEDKFEDDKLEEKKTRAYSRVVGYVKKQD